jgi:inhibitor of KinA sporulation pathway (predicted exonuclease)
MHRIMVLDCEYTQPNKRCIQIGAAVYDARKAGCLDSFETYVDPREPISQYITDLTGIRNQDVQGAPDIVEAFRMLERFHCKNDCFQNPLVWGSGDRNDSLALYEEYSEALLEIPYISVVPENFMGRRVIDAKDLFVSFQLFNDGQYAGGLKSSMKRLGLKFEGSEHTALADARNTFTLWYYLTRKMSNGYSY